MKISIKLAKEEAEAFKTFMTAIKPPDVTEENFFKQLFFMGCKSLDDQLRDLFEQEKARLEKDQPPQESEAQTEETK